MFHKDSNTSEIRYKDYSSKCYFFLLAQVTKDLSSFVPGPGSTLIHLGNI